MKLSAHNVNVKIKGRDILKDVSVVFEPGLHFIMGLNGSGKTTLLRCIQKEASFLGNILIGQKNIKDYSTKELSKLIAVVPQRADLPYDFTVYEFVLMGRFPFLPLLGNYSPEDHLKVEKALAEMQLEAFKSRYLRSLSGGELQKAFLARAWAQEAPILLLDEPSQALDPRNKQLLYKQLLALAKAGKNILCTTHDTEVTQIQEADLLGIKNGENFLLKKADKVTQEDLDCLYGLNSIP